MSTPGEGSTFHFTASFQVPDATERPPLDVALTDHRVLIVDDHAVNRGILLAQVSRWQMAGTAVEGARTALAELVRATEAGDPYTLVLADADMPDCDGFWLVEQMNAREEIARAAVVMLTSARGYGDLERCRELGIRAHLTKPVRATDLLAAIKQALGRFTPVVTVPGPKNVSPIRAKVLLVEDNIINQRVALGLLANRGHEVTIVSNGKDAIAATLADGFDVVLMDVEMPVLGGLEATAAIRRREQETGGHVRIVAMTAHAMVGDRDRCLEAGMDGYLSKPIDCDQLYDAVETVPAGSRATSSPGRSPATSVP